MPYSYKWIGDRSIVKVQHAGNVPFAEIQGCINQLAEIVDPDNLPGLLVDLRSVTRYPSELEIAVEMEGLDRQPRIARRTAFITNDVTLNTTKLIVHSAGQQGFEVRDFTDEAEATIWLLARD